MKKLALFEAMIANLFWGFGFTATIWALQSFSLSQILFVRFAVVGLTGIGWILFRERVHLGRYLKLTFLPAIFLIIEILFQIWGLKYTTATNAGFLTVTYIIMIPLLERIFFSKPIGLAHWRWVFVAVLGTLMMIEFQIVGGNWGDVLILISALGASLHMLVVDKIGKTEKNLFIANAIQSFWGALVLLPFLLVDDSKWQMAQSLKPWLGLASLTFGTTMLAFYFQMRAQKELSPSVSSLLFLIESPIAALFGFALLQEEMNGLQWFGCALILFSAAGVIRQNLNKK